MNGHYTALASAFDALAPDYDANYGPAHNLVMAWLRQESLALLRSTFPPKANLLEIGCGSGEEALALARHGYRITATDVSSGMAALTQRKAAAAGLKEHIKAVAIPAAHLQALRPPRRFQGAYASFGSLNCEPDLQAFGRSLAVLVEPGASFVCTIMARMTPFEILWFLAHAQLGQALRRWNGDWQDGRLRTNGGPQLTVPVRYLTAAAVAEALAPHFTLLRTMSMGLLLPPPYLDALYRKGRPIWNRLLLLERRLRECRPWCNIGDHVALVLRRR
ncbi:MAG: class I SAM-dependent methyltransferase [Candidatus Promineifilaceae bacterium]|nr:class I SAM-dependent methyltransferase [Candidatus Promineifilaceae bacterium]